MLSQRCPDPLGSSEEATSIRTDAKLPPLNKVFVNRIQQCEFVRTEENVPKSNSRTESTGPHSFSKLTLREPYDQLRWSSFEFRPCLMCNSCFGSQRDQVAAEQNSHKTPFFFEEWSKVECSPEIRRTRFDRSGVSTGTIVEDHLYFSAFLNFSGLFHFCLHYCLWQRRCPWRIAFKLGGGVGQSCRRRQRPLEWIVHNT